MAATTCHAPAVVAGDSFLSPLLTRSWEKHTLCGEERPSELTRFLPMRPAAECACVCGVELAGTSRDLCGPATVTPSGCLLSPAGLSPASPPGVPESLTALPDTLAQLACPQVWPQAGERAVPSAVPTVCPGGQLGWPAARSSSLLLKHSAGHGLSDRWLRW